MWGQSTLLYPLLYYIASAHCLFGVSFAFTSIKPKTSISNTIKSFNNNNNNQQSPYSSSHFSSSFALWSTESNDNVDSVLEEMDQERKDSLFQFLLRDLQVEGAPILGCDADQAHTLQAALWTTMAELVEGPKAQKACLVFDTIPIDALRQFVNDFENLKTQSCLMESIPELSRFNVSLVGQGVGPAIVIETNNATSTTAVSKPETLFNEYACNAATKTFVDRMVMGNSGIALQEPVAYRFSNANNVCGILSLFWNCICELLTNSEEQLGTTIVPMPNSGDADRFNAISELISQSLNLFRGSDVFDVNYFAPDYDRNTINPSDQPAFGHLPPLGWIEPMVEFHLREKAPTLSNDDIALQNYQRQSPIPTMIIQRTSFLDAVTKPEDGIVNINLPDGQVVMASGCGQYTKTAMNLIETGAEKLQEQLDAEKNIIE